MFLEYSLNYRKLFSTCVPHKHKSSREEVQCHLITHFINHFAQAKGTLFTTEPITTLLGEDLNTQFATTFLNGQVDVKKYPGIPREMKKILQELSPKPTDPPPIEVYITPEQIMQGFKIWKEQTLTSP